MPAHIVFLFPTILSSLGVEFDGEQLGLGTDMFSCKETIFDRYGINTNDELNKKSLFYDRCIVNNYCD